MYYMYLFLNTGISKGKVEVEFLTINIREQTNDR